MHSTPSEIIASQVRKRRQQMDLNRQKLAARCAEIGAPQLTTAALTNIETGRPDKDGKRRREVTVEELLALAHALGVHPVDLMVPGGASDDEPYNVTPEVATTAAVAREWISGREFLSPPKTAAELAEAIRWMPEGRAQAVAEAWLRPEQRFGYFAKGNKVGAQQVAEQEGKS